MMDYADKMQKCNEYIEALEVERRKIQVFQRELPLCLELVSQAIDACRQQLSSSSSPAAAGVGTSHECFHVRQQQSECSEQTSSHGPVLEEFIPIKRVASCSSEDGADDDEEEEDESGEKSGKKSDWLRSVQLWNQSPDPAPVSEVKKNGGAFRPYDKEKVVAAEEMADRRPVENKPASSTTVKSRKEESNSEKESGQTQRKQRRCWSPELHRRFIHSLQQLGGPHVATPKQIKELMKVDGLTNDEVKSHLQKYRLHMRRPSAAMPSSSNSQGPQFVVVGGLWVPPPECPAAVVTAATATSSGDQGKAKSGKNEARTPSNGVYAPVATVGTPFVRPASKTQKNRQKGHHCEEEEGSHSTQGGGARAHSSSPASSSSTHTTAIAAASPESS